MPRWAPSQKEIVSSPLWLPTTLEIFWLRGRPAATLDRSSVVVTVCDFAEAHVLKRCVRDPCSSGPAVHQHTLESGGGSGSARFPRVRSGPGDPVPVVLVSALCLRPAALAPGPGCPGSDPGVLRPPPREGLPAAGRSTARPLPCVSVNRFQTLPGQGTRAGSCSQTRRGPDVSAFGLQPRRAALPPGAEPRGHTGSPVRAQLGPDASRTRPDATARRAGRRRQGAAVRVFERHAHG